MLPKLYTLAQTAEMLGISPNTLRRWDNSGYFKAVRMGNRGDRRYRQEDIDSIISNSIHQLPINED